MANFSDLGAQCSLPDCRQADFLPFKCDCCDKVFCLDHFQYKDHSCEKSFQKDRQVAVCPICTKSFALVGQDDMRINNLWERHMTNDCTGRQQKEKCPTSMCKEKLTELNSHICKTCNTKVCLKHRYEDMHPCQELLKAKKSAGMSRLLGGGSSSTTAKPKSSQTKGSNFGNFGGSKSSKASKSAKQWPCGRCGTCSQCQASRNNSSGQWACSKCTLLNPNTSDQCNVCNAMRPKTAVPKVQMNAVSSTPTPDVGIQWTCNGCKLSNPGTTDACQTCGRKRQNANAAAVSKTSPRRQDARPSPNASPREEWECSGCQYSNHYTRKDCLMCGRKRSLKAEGCAIC